MKPPFHILNAEPAVPEQPQLPPVPVPGTAESGCDFVLPTDGGVFDGAGGFDPKAATRGDPPDVGSKPRQLLWERGLSVPRAAAATLDRFCCLTGPCKWYSEIHVDEPDTLPEPRVRVIRLCRRHLDDDGGTLEMTEGTIPACLSYDPPWWSLDGWRMKLIVARRIDFALHEISKVMLSPVWAKLVEWRVIPREDGNYGGQ